MLLDPDSSHLSSTIVLLMELKSAPFRTIAEVRAALEPMISSLAAQRIADDSLIALKQTIDRMAEHIDDEYLFLEVNKEFHDIIAWSSGNALFGYIVESLLGIMDGTLIGIDYPEPRRAAILKAHEEIYFAISSHDAPAAEQRMREHIDAYIKYAQRKFPEAMDQVVPWGRTRE